MCFSNFSNHRSRDFNSNASGFHHFEASFIVGVLLDSDRVSAPSLDSTLTQQHNKKKRNCASQIYSDAHIAQSAFAERIVSRRPVAHGIDAHAGTTVRARFAPSTNRRAAVARRYAAGMARRDSLLPQRAYAEAADTPEIVVGRRAVNSAAARRAGRPSRFTGGRRRAHGRRHECRRGCGRARGRRLGSGRARLPRPRRAARAPRPESEPASAAKPTTTTTTPAPVRGRRRARARRRARSESRRPCARNLPAAAPKDVRVARRARAESRPNRAGPPVAAGRAEVG